jgi:hypothetical protein
MPAGAVDVNVDVFGPAEDSSIPIHLDDVQCYGSEQDIRSCLSNLNFNRSHNCRHSDDVGVICKAGMHQLYGNTLNYTDSSTLTWFNT